MKTHLQILTALALIIQGMVNGQTQGNQAKKISVTDKKAYVVFGADNTKTQATTKPSSTPASNNPLITKKTLAVSGSISAYNKSLTIKGTANDAKNLLAQAEEMLSIEKQLRKQAKQLKGEERTKLMNSANELAKQIELVNIQASEITGKINKETYDFNSEIYQALLTDPNVNDNFVEHSEKLNAEAEKTIKIAKEMRQEAYAMHSNSAKLGTMLNAEEKESIALNKQKEAIEVLTKVSDAVASIR